MTAARFIVRGKVQGVWFRASTRDVAVRLGLAGHARNLPDGRVEVLVTGDAGAIDQLQAWLHEGPPMARVDGVERTDAEGIETAGIETPSIAAGAVETGAIEADGFAVR